MAVSMIPPAGATTFLDNAGWQGADIMPLAGDASFRRYFRITRGAARAVLMDAPPPKEDIRPFVDMAEYLVATGFSAPAILARDVDQGLLLLEDFGSERMRETVDTFPDRQHKVYKGVTDLLVSLHQQPVAPYLNTYDMAHYLREVGLFLDFYCPLVGLDTHDPAGFANVWEQLLAPVVADQAHRPVTVLRDYHAENIMILPDRTGHARWGLLDFQDALAGHPAYDLVSILQDARRDVPSALEREMLDHYCVSTGEDAAFRDAYWILGAQRNTKILGIFARLSVRDGKDHYLGYMPRMWGLLERDLAQPALAPLRDWFGCYVPSKARSAYWGHER